MQIKAVGFDVGQTLVDYNAPLSWKSLFPDALQSTMRALSISSTSKNLELASKVLSKYNTRENYREFEVSSDLIFGEILNAWACDYEMLGETKKAFYSFFQSKAVFFEETTAVLHSLSSRSILLGFLTDVAYGMDNIYALADIEEIRAYFDAGFTSVDIGFRKPNTKGFEKLLQALDVSPSQMLYVGDEEKDIVGASNAGIISVLVNRSDVEKDLGQKYTIKSLHEILDIL